MIAKVHEAEIVGAKQMIVANVRRRRSAAPAVAVAAGIVDGALGPVIAGAREKRPHASPRRRVAGIRGAGVAVVAVQGRGAALSGGGVTAVHGARVAVVAAGEAPLANEGAARIQGAGLRGGASVLIITGVSRGAGSSG